MLGVNLEQLPWVVLILTLGATVQGAIGFGMGLFSIPLLVWIGLALPQAIGTTLPIVFLQTCFNCWQHRSDLPWREIWPMFLLRIVGLPAGVFLLYRIAEFDVTTAKQIIGGFLLVALAVQWRVHPRPRSHVHCAWTAIAGFLSGLCAGMVGMGGPAITLWVLAHDWPPIRQRTFLWLSFLLIMPLHVTLLISRFGSPLATAMATACALAPLTLIGAWFGANLGGRLDRKKLRLAMLGLLIVIAISSIASPWMLT